MIQDLLVGILIAEMLFVIAAILKRRSNLHKVSEKDIMNGCLTDISEHELKSIGLLKRLYRFDFENSQVEIPLEFDDTTEIMEPLVSDKNHIAFSSDFLEMLMDKISYIPKQFCVNIAISFRCFNGYSCEDVMNAVQEKIEGCYNMVMEQNAKKYFKMLTYIIICIVFSLIGTIPITVDYTSGVEGIYSMIIGILIENAAALILWQAGYTIFDILEQGGVRDASLYRKINQISIVGENNRIIAKEQTEIFEYCPLFKRRERIAYVVMLLANAYVVSICVIEAISYILAQFSLSTADQIIFFAEWIIILFITYTNITFYFDKGSIAKHAFKISVGLIFVFAIYNIGRLIYIKVNAVPFDYDDFLFTYLMLSIVNAVCIYIIQKERKRRINHLISICLNRRQYENFSCL